MQDYQRAFIELARRHDVLKFGEFTLKSGRVSPYFFNAGAFASGEALAELGRCYADRIVDAGIEFDVLPGPAYKGIPLAAATAIALSDRHGRDVPFAYNRKEAKDHGEGGHLVGAPLAGRVLIVDDVISAGTSVRESIRWITDAGAVPAGVAIALDRQERGQGQDSASREVEQAYGIPVVAIAGLDDLIEHVSAAEDSPVDVNALLEYRARYGVAPGAD